MPLSKTRQIGEAFTDDKPLPAEDDLKIFEVFTRKAHGSPHVHAGALHLIKSNDQRHSRNPIIPQIVSSGLSRHSDDISNYLA